MYRSNIDFSLVCCLSRRFKKNGLFFFSASPIARSMVPMIPMISLEIKRQSGQIAFQGMNVMKTKCEHLHVVLCDCVFYPSFDFGR